MNGKMQEFTIKGIALDGINGMPTIILQSADTGSILPLRIGPFEASAIIIEIENVHPPRPMTHDLLSEFFIRHNFRLKNLIIYKKMEDDYLAKIEYTKGLRHYKMEVRPSDGIALAIRLRTPIYVSPDVIMAGEKGSVLLDQIKDYPSEILYFEPNNTGAHMM